MNKQWGYAPCPEKQKGIPSNDHFNKEDYFPSHHIVGDGLKIFRHTHVAIL
jgi:hypothetical protein